MIEVRRVAGLVLLLALVGVRPAAAGDTAPAAAGEIHVSIAPTELRLGQDTEAEVVAELPAGIERVIFLAAHGRIADAEVDGRRAVARYRPPDDFLPRVEVIAALVFVAGEPRWGFAALPLIGQGAAVIKTRPFAEAEIHIGEQVYGPVKADRRGRAEIEIEVPPGTSVGIDGEGNEVDLQVPAAARVAVFAARPEISMAQAAPVELLVVVVGKDGGPADDDAPVLNADRGSIEGVRAAGPGIFIASYVPPGGGTGVVQIEAGVADEESPPSIAEIVLVPGGGSQQPDGVGTGGDETPGAAAPQEPLPWLTAALKAGFAWNLGSLQGFDVMVDATVKLPLWREQFRVGLEVGFSRMSSEAEVQAGDLAGSTLDSTTWFVPLAGTIAFAQPLTHGLKLVLSAQGALVLLDNRVDLVGGGASAAEQHELAYGPGAGGALALEWSLGPGAALFEARSSRCTATRPSSSSTLATGLRSCRKTRLLG
jgi:hypothetical protein